MTLLQDLLKALKSNQKNTRLSAIATFRDVFRKKIVNQAKQLYPDEIESEKEIDNTLKMMLSAIIEYNYHPTEEELIKILKKTLSLTSYEKRLNDEMLYFLKNQSSEYFGIEKKIRKLFNPYLQLIYKFTEVQNTAFPSTEIIIEDWIQQQAFDNYLYKVLGKDEQNTRNKLGKFSAILYEKYLTCIIRYADSQSLRQKAESEIDRMCRISFAEMRRTDVDLLSESVELLLKDLARRDFIIKTNLQNYWQGILRKLTKQSYREQQPQEEFKVKKAIKSNLFTLEETYDFIQEGLDAIEKVHAGNARQLLLTGRRTHFIRLIIGAMLAESSKKIIQAGKKYQYKNKQSEAQQRQDCKKALVDWMKNEVNQPEGNWNNPKGRAIYQYICNDAP